MPVKTIRGLQYVASSSKQISDSSRGICNDELEEGRGKVTRHELSVGARPASSWWSLTVCSRHSTPYLGPISVVGRVGWVLEALALADKPVPRQWSHRAIVSPTRNWGANEQDTEGGGVQVLSLLVERRQPTASTGLCS